MSKQEEPANKTKDNDIDYAIEWYRYGLNEDDDLIIKFMMHWIAFNWLYSECGFRHESDNIREYCRKNWERLSEYEAFETEAFQVIAEKPVASQRRGRVTGDNMRDYQNLSSDNELTRITSLMLTIYHVRCNLFHGSKSLKVKRDVNLVRASSTIMEGYLKALLPPNA